MQAKGANETAQAAQNSARTVDATVQGMQRIQDKVALSAQKVQEMGTRSAQIGVIVETIDDIASQTNMLALNAAIEAARAGEHGKGFAVVADEVRKLAEKSASAAKEIAVLVKGIQTTVNEAVGAMDDGAREVETGVSLVEQSGQVFNEILQAAEHGKSAGAAIVNAAKHMNQLSTALVEAMDAVSAVVEQNTTVTQMMTENANEVTRAVENIAAVSEENSAAVEQVSASTEEMSAQVEEVAASAQALVELAQMMRQMAGQFQLE
jgi:methyl-accepting chemotaxis protein